MRSPGRKRPFKRAVAGDPDFERLEKCAQAVEYVGSAEHKTYPSFAGPARGRSDAYKCPTDLKDAKVLTTWLQSAIRAGHVSEATDGEYPRYVWIRRKDQWFEARITNAVLGQYKGYPLADDEAPTGVES